ncbi:nucleotide pyrophosphohydrolase [Paenibacillus sp. GP183]|uniref:nucleotide pyrophosphohydrolase n=1 Tax=Paenibacillus sp. GP183 TaxID=1882751 RepID=UPI000897458A|nr:nucleotide pyrophosphohydrolase [Paenibacillus sp. GP183]SEC00334.1 NTP pyrophosphatase, house-cleaning of non-canonical NTPs [Paenibacillus sp. GP183]
MEAIIKSIIEFRDARDWKQFHNPKDLAISLSLEASELLENFQWKDSKTALIENMDEIKNELADVLIYALMMANDLEIDVETIILNKLKINEAKYSVEKYKGSSRKYSEN